MQSLDQTRSQKAALLLMSAAALGGVLTWLLCGATDGGAASNPGAASAPVDAADAAAVTQAALVRTDAEQRAGYYTAPVGTVLTYALHGRCDYGVGQPESGRQSSGFQLRGALTVAVADRRGDEILTEVTLTELALSPLDGAVVPANALGQVAQVPFHARLGADGSVRGYRFADRLAGEQRNFLRGLFSAYAHRVPADAHGTWDSKDVDAAGELVARFTLQAGSDGDAVSVERRKLRYEAMAGAELHPHTIVGQSRATLSRGLGWIAAVDVDELMTLKLVELGVDVDVRAVFRFALQAQGTQAAAPLPALWDEPWQAAAGHQEDLTAGGVEYERDRWSKRLAGESLTTLTQALTAALAIKPEDAAATDAAWEALIWLVKLRPEVAAEIQQAIGAGMESRLGDMLLTALGAAGTDPAQNVLAAMRRDPGLAAPLRTSATMALFQLAHPNQRVLGDIASDIASAGELTGDSAMAMLLLGALAPRAGEERVGGRTALETLLAFEGKAQQQDRLDLWLNALGNVGTDALVPHAQRLTGHERDSVRGAAYHALRRVETPAAVALLVQGLADLSPSVRTDVVTALGEHRSPAASAALIRAARDDADPAVRRASQRALVRFAKPETPARQALALLAGSDPDEATRAAARDLVRALR